MKKLKWILGGLVVIVIAFAVTAYALLASFDVEAYRDVIQAEVRKATGRELTLDGPVDLRVSLTPAVTAERVAFGNAEWGSRPQMATLERFEVEMELMPLLSGEVKVTRLVLVEPDILVEVDAEGRSNLDFGGTVEEGESASAPPDLAINVNAVTIENGRLTYRDGASGEEMTVELDSLEATAASFSDPIALALQGRYKRAGFFRERRLRLLPAAQQRSPFPST